MKVRSQSTRGGSLDVAEGMNIKGAQPSRIDITGDPILQHMVDTYPRLFQGSIPQSHSYVQPGWKNLVDDLCFRIDRMLIDDQARLFAVRQIKDKLGTLRFYFSFGSAMEQLYTERESTRAAEEALNVSGDRNAEIGGKIHAAIEEAINRSNTICSVCSRPGRMHDLHGLLSVRCDDHSSVR